MKQWMAGAAMTGGCRIGSRRRPSRHDSPTFDTAQAIAMMLEKHGIACDLVHGFNWDERMSD